MSKTRSQKSDHKSKRVLWISVTVVVSLGVLFAFARSFEPTSQLIQNARKAYERSEFEEALQVTRKILNREPGNSDTLWISGRSHARLKHYAEAIRDLNQIVLESPDGVDARLLVAEILHYRVCQFDEAEKTYVAVLQHDVMNANANDGLARLLAVCGRRNEAIPLILRLVQQQQASDLLLVLARESGAINDADLLQRAHKANPDSAAPLLGLARLADLKEQTEESVTLCSRAVQLSPGMVAAHVELGRYLLQLGRYSELNDWRINLPPGAEASAEIQKLIGFIEIHLGHRTQALSVFLSAAKSLPDSRDVCHQISQLLFEAGDSDAAQLYVEQLENIRRLYDAQDQVLFSSNEPSAVSLQELIRAFEQSGRLLEAYGWSQLAIERFPDNTDLRQVNARLGQETATLQLCLVPESGNPAFVLSHHRYVIEDIAVVEAEPPKNSANTNDGLEGVSFSEVSTELGLDFVYSNGGVLKRRIFEFGGGGVGCEDLDRDGYPDIVFSQGGDWDQRGTPENQRDVLFRNMRGSCFREVSKVASFGSTDYGQGVAIGDIDEDGFPDILVAGIGGARLWMNLGDGTFQNQGPCSVPRTTADPWITSCAIADLNQDSLPDIYLVGYLAGPDVYERICVAADGSNIQCLPSVFAGETDYLLLNDGVGGFVNASDLLPVSTAEGRGLGLLVFAPTADADPGVYLANDTTPNSLLIRNAATERWDDNAFASGVAVGRSGKAEGSMGIALGDVNADSIPDLVVTNFLNEGTAFYRGIGNSAFVDDRSTSGLLSFSSTVLGFGVQFLDADLDGNPEMFVSNGHVDDLQHFGKPYQMPAQLFAIQQGRFQLQKPDQLGSYFQRNHLGRAVAKTDWNADGKPDLVLGNIQEPSVLLSNTSHAAGKSLQIRLVSPGSNRDAVCASVTCQSGTHRQIQQLTAGDGYQCSNEKLITFGMHGIDAAELLSIRWPSGSVQEFQNVSLPNRIVIVEGRATLFTLPK